MIPKAIPKIGVFFFDPGGSLSRAVDLPALVQRLAKVKNVIQREVFMSWDNGELLKQIQGSLQGGLIDRLLWVGKFSDTQKKKIKEELRKAGLNPYMQEWCDLEEQGVGGLDRDRLIPTQKALILIQMALARTRHLSPLEPLELPGNESILIVGAGVAGLHAAASMEALGKKVHLVEKESGVGGKVASLRNLYPRICDPRCGLEFVLEKIKGSDRVEIHTLSKVVELNGGPGNFQVRLQKGPRYVDLEKCNACGACEKVCPVEIPSQVPLPSFPGVMEDPKERSSFPLLTISKRAIHPPAPMPYPPAYCIERGHCPPQCRRCAEICPSGAVTLDQAPVELDLRVGAILVTTGWDLYPLEKVEELGYGIYPQVITNLEIESWIDHIPSLEKIGFYQCAGSRDERHLPYCSSVCCTVTLKQILALKEKYPHLFCCVFYEDLRASGFDEELYWKVKALDGVLFIRGKPAVIRPGEKGKLYVGAEDTLSGKALDFDLDLMVLAGGMIPSIGTKEIAPVLKLPRTEQGFFESHLACHPEESQRTGIRVGGACRGPMNIAQAIESSHRALMDLLPFLQEKVQVEPTYPVVNLAKCDKCKRCMEECPFQCFYFDPNGFPIPDLAKCRQCGNCVGICPLAAISMGNFTISQVASQIQAIKSSFLGKTEPVILAFLCANDAYPAARRAALSGLPIPPNVFFIKVPCAGAVNNAFIADALSFGIDGVLIAGCKDGQCHYVKGNQLVQTRREDLSEKLKKMVMEPERIRFETLEIGDSVKYLKLIDAFIQELRRIGPNPLKS